jgi:hypothetical protein
MEYLVSAIGEREKLQIAIAVMIFKSRSRSRAAILQVKTGKNFRMMFLPLHNSIAQYK